jgi:hypothetical protein
MGVIVHGLHVYAGTLHVFLLYYIPSRASEGIIFNHLGLVEA